jgi:hypothetical protein
MLVIDRETLAIDKIRALFGEPPLIKGESEQLYWRLWKAFEDDIKPKSLPEWIAVNDLVHKYWEQLRLRRYSPAFIESACIEVLEVLLRPYVGAIPEMEHATSDIARFYYVGLNGAKHRAVEFVTECGITPDQILACAMQKCGPGLLIFDRMDTNRDIASRVLRKELERRAATGERDMENKESDPGD